MMACHLLRFIHRFAVLPQLFSLTFEFKKKRRKKNEWLFFRNFQSWCVSPSSTKVQKSQQKKKIKIKCIGSGEFWNHLNNSSWTNTLHRSRTRQRGTQETYEALLWDLTLDQKQTNKQTKNCLAQMKFLLCVFALDLWRKSLKCHSYWWNLPELRIIRQNKQSAWTFHEQSKRWMLFVAHFRVMQEWVCDIVHNKTWHRRPECCTRRAFSPVKIATFSCPPAVCQLCQGAKPNSD